MLVLTRKAGESILIGSEIELKIISVQGDQMKIGISAPKNIEVLRKELVEEISDSNREALESFSNLSELVDYKKNS
ncbi:carbon storage regulator [Jeotgalibacillus sp. S-D1]|uniref:carbon storage regulator CsrA n=1 Tax=Jeotgalibacillus sp. S-D1 TaxID=2552189 RepID=UPI0010592549|nr:carbon storage regulator CsrA [Jeotgalibacillus sp. S-D1]TDL32583.1 carbon storage regulator [Jeotgalibacillus sp. S-D1]